MSYRRDLVQAKRTASQDSTYNIRKNPLNIRHDDGSDLVLAKPSPSNPGSKMSEPVAVEPSEASKTTIESSFLGAVPVLPDIIDLSILDTSPQLLELGKFHHGPTLSRSLENLLDVTAATGKHEPLPPKPPAQAASLGRKNTITSSNHKDTTSAPSTDTSALQRLRSARLRLDEGSAKDAGVQHHLHDDHIVEQLKAMSTPPTEQAAKFHSRHVSVKIEHEVALPAEKQVDEKPEAEVESLYDDSEDTAESEPASPVMLSSPTLGDLDPIDSADRGRLFLKISGLKGLNLPLVASRHPHFTLTLDNGLQTVTTHPLDMTARGEYDEVLVPIDHEFELVVGTEELQLILTLSGTMDPLPPPPPQPERARSSSPVKRSQSPVKQILGHSRAKSVSTPPSSPKKKMFGLFKSPRKQFKQEVDRIETEFAQKQLEQQQQLEQQREREEALEKQRSKAAERKASERKAAAKTEQSSVEDVWTGKVGRRGEFGRAYLIESQFENEIYGRPQTFILSCFNEWAKDRDPYRICGLQVKMMYIPRFYRSEDLPTSMKSCMKELKQASERRQVHMSGYMSQQGGDCKYWRRRWFTLDGARLVGHHEESHQVRNVVNLTNAVSVVQSAGENAASSDGLCDEQEFHVEFQDGETLQFYAETIESRDEWIKQLGMALAHCSGKTRRWYDLVLQHQEHQQQSQQALEEKYQERHRQSVNGMSGFIETV